MMNVNFNNLQFSAPKQNSFGGQHVYINQPDRSKVCISTPICSLPFGVNTYKGSNTLDLQVSDQEFNSFLSDFDNYVLEVAEKNSFSWFKKNMHQKLMTKTSYGGLPSVVNNSTRLEPELIRIYRVYD